MQDKKLDLVMWTKDGAKTLPFVLNQINRVVPEYAVHRRVIIDDGSSDNTETIARKSGWSVHMNEGKGISDAANTALGYVESESFASFEQDVLLSPLWWSKVPKLLDDPDTAIASGIRLPSQPLPLRKFIDAQARDSERRGKKREDGDPFNFGKTLDNTIYRTEAIRNIGGFPRIPTQVQCMLDNILAKQIHDAGFKWNVYYDVKSLHIRKNFLDELRHYYWYGESEDFAFSYIKGKYPSIRDRQKLFLQSFIWGATSALKMNSPQLFYICPLLQFAELQGLLSDRKTGGSQRALLSMHANSCGPRA